MESYIFPAKFFVYSVNHVPSVYFCCNRNASKFGGRMGGIKVTSKKILDNSYKYSAGFFSKNKQTKYSIFIINWEKLRSPIIGAFKNRKTSL